MKLRTVLAGAAVLALGAGVLYIARPDDIRSDELATRLDQTSSSVGAGESTSQGEASESPWDGTGADGSDSSNSGADPGPADRTVLVQRDALALIVDPVGEPIEGARVSWTALPRELAGEPPLTADEILRAVEERTELGVSSSDGRWMHPKAERLLGASAVVWASSPGRRAGYTVHAAGEFTARLELEPAANVPVLVLDASGQPAEGAEVIQRGRLPWPPIRASGDDNLLEAATALFLRRSTTDADGRTLAAAHPGRTLLSARKDGLVSAEIELADQPELVLRLAPSFTAEGRVIWPAGHDPSAGARVVVYELLDGRLQTSLVAPVDRAGTWRAESIPLRGGTSFTFKLEATGLMPVQEERPAPAPGERLALEFRPEPGLALDVLILEELEDGAQVGVAGARVSLSWRAEAGRIWNQGSTDGDGRVRIEGLPAGEVAVSVARDGYVALRPPPIRLPAPPGAVLDLVLERAGRLAGRCTFRGEPVSDFNIVHWRSPGGTRSHERFRDRPDGRFVVESAPLGTLLVMASSERYPECEPVAVELTGAGIEDLELALPEPVAGRGRVVDAASGEPVAGAWVAPVLAFGRGLMGERGARQPVGPDGDFELDGLAPRDSRVRVGAPGYPIRYATATARSGEPIDFGRIQLAGPQRLTVLLEGVDDPTRYEFQADGVGASLPYLRFPPKGVLEFEDVQPGEYTAWLFPDEAPVRSWIMRLIPGRSWIEHISLDGCRALEVELVPAEDVPLPRDGTLLVAWEDAQGREHDVSVGVFGEPRLRFPCVEAEAVDLTLLDGAGVPLASEHIAVPRAEPRTVRLELGGSALSLRVVDPDGRALPGALVVLTGTEGSPGGWAWRDVSDHDGRVRFGRPPHRELRVAAYHPRHGIAMRAGLRSVEGAQTLELVVGEGRPVELLLLDGDAPVAGVDVGLCPFGTPRALLFLQSDEDGRVHLPRTTPGSFVLVLERRGLWTTSERVEVGAGASTIEVQVRGVGHLELSVLDGQGAPLADVEVELRPLELAGDVRAWLRAGLVEASSHALRTDAKGALTLRGLPRGAYACSVAGEGEGETLHVGSELTLRHELRVR